MRARRRWGALLGVAVASAVGLWCWHRPGAKDRSQNPVERRASAPPTAGVHLDGRAPGSPTAETHLAAETGTGIPERATQGSAVPPSATRPARLRVVVRSGERLLAGAEVSIGSITALTDAEGIARFDGLTLPKVLVSARAAGFLPSEEPQPVELEAELEAESALELEPARALEGLVVQAGSGRPVAGAVVHSRGGGETPDFSCSGGRDSYGTATTDEGGRFRFDALPLDWVVTLWVESRGSSRAETCVRLRPGGPPRPPVRLEVEAGGWLLVSVRDAAGVPVPGAQVQIASLAQRGGSVSPLSSEHKPYEGARWWARAVTGAQGQVEVLGLPLNVPLRARALRSGHAPSEEARGLVAAESAPGLSLTLSLRAPATLTLLLQAPAGQTIPWAFVQARPPGMSDEEAVGGMVCGGVSCGATPGVFAGESLDGGPASDPAAGGAACGGGGLACGGAADDPWLPTALPDAVAQAPLPTRSYRFQGLPPGPLEIHVRAGGYRGQRLTVQVPEGANLERTVVLDPGLSLAGTAVDEQGRPVPRVHVRATPSAHENIGEASATTDELGRFRLGGLLAGRFDVSTTDAGPVASDDPQGPQTGAALEAGRLEGVRAPATGLRLVLLRKATVRLTLRAPAGHVLPRQVTTWTVRGGGSRGSTRELPLGTALVEWALARADTGIRLTCADFAPIERTVDPKDGGTIDLGVIELDPGVTLTGRVRDVQGKALGGALVALSEASELTSVDTDAAGEFRFDHLPRAAYVLRVSTDEHPATEHAVDLSAGAARAEVVLPTGRRLAIRLLDSQGEPVDDRFLDCTPLQRAPGEPANTWTKADARGRCELVLRLGRYRLGVDVDGDVDFEREIEVSDTSEATLTIRLP